MRPLNPFVATPEQEAARRERQSVQANTAESLRLVYDPCGNQPRVEHPLTKRVFLSLSDQENEQLTGPAQGQGVGVGRDLPSE